MIVGLRIDVDTFRGTKYGVPKLCALLAKHSIKASFFFCVGPDNMGRHVRRMLRPAFLLKMLRSKAGSLYGWDILLRGTLWPGPWIGRKLGPIIRVTANAGHEIGLHAWDHYTWQTKIDKMDRAEIRQALEQGIKSLTGILGFQPTCSAAPAWKCTDQVLLEKEKYPFQYNSDCRGKSIFRPLIGQRELSQPQIPVTLPTYDELIGREQITDTNYNDYLLSLLEPDRLNVLTIHAEVEGIAYIALFADFLNMARARGVEFVPLGTLITSASVIQPAKMVAKEIQGREGWVACQVENV
jgi:undecaprenyl phosphate-alpha-L-ara4FN deformylase